MKVIFIKIFFFIFWYYFYYIICFINKICYRTSKSIFRASRVGLCNGNRKLSSWSFSVSGLFSGKGGEGGMSQNRGVLRSLFLQSNSSLLLGGALGLLYLQSNFSSLLSFGIVIGRLILLYLRSNSSLPSLLSSSSSLLLKLLLLLLF